ncbi:DNA primase [Tessaracoccus sp. SD287]|uniref:DNA primase n=1 Tax=Tessaracoccus sp. SD287 TaxID=2782008 RepID=UPI001A973B27|nr:DNA primase [Tessaracoccus sp. SD287]MBO1032087.1 DNA primase [Tessaracoccus sp. SD287]
MAGRINDEDIALVRERARIDEVVGQYVALRNAGGGSMKGLCPFHDEKTPSFHVTPSRGFYHCFGCGEGGDAITFLQKHNNLTFTEAIQYLADKTGVQLRIIEDGNARPGLPPGMRVQILEANAAAAEYFSRQLMSPEALIARQMLDGRGFDKTAAEQFGVGYAPRGGRELRHHLNAKGYRDEVLVKAGLVRENGFDFFQGRLLWPIRDSGSSTLGFGARRLHEDDRLPAKYINSPETPVYKKSQVLYGLDLARQNIGKKGQAVVVEGYTDVMAAHLSGVDTAVASCGTAFGDDHARLLQRLMGNNDAFNGEVVFTFDGDAAGQKAALKVFSGDRNFIAQTYVAVEPHGLDPCDLRLEHGEAAVRELVARRVPLYRFVMSNVISGYDLDRADGRLAAVRAAAPLVSSIRDTSLVNGYARELSTLVGMDLDEVRREVSRAARRPLPTEVPRQTRPHDEPVVDESPALVSSVPMPRADDREFEVERGTLKLMLQQPLLFDDAWNGVTAQFFAQPAYRLISEAITREPYTGQRWTDDLLERIEDEQVSALVVELLVEQLPVAPDEAYATSYAARLQLIAVTRDINNLKSRLQRTNPVEHETEHKRMFSDLLALETRRKRLQQVSAGMLG